METKQINIVYKNTLTDEQKLEIRNNLFNKEKNMLISNNIKENIYNNRLENIKK
jgi:hypothetical protein